MPAADKLTSVRSLKGRRGQGAGNRALGDLRHRPAAYWFGTHFSIEAGVATLEGAAVVFHHGTDLVQV
jgi:hypothetical protein